MREPSSRATIKCDHCGLEITRHNIGFTQKDTTLPCISSDREIKVNSNAEKYIPEKSSEIFHSNAFHELHFEKHLKIFANHAKK